ncbi:fluoride efflux transporter CrcB [Bacillus sp. EB600]|uniref:fluoride efflux transporter CrcB n=1 Tax=Bacillus sp. EB600 TaxID=2806345 RepID=UPI00210E333C|nr:fluoride efflux transporter CrcB [Bacillus sp. EB600]MCQ6282113.1 fluoride efflux transporter CrcB [Bacillus sp. EB600]
MVEQIWLVGLGGFFGAAARYWVNLTFSKTKLFPLGTFVVNLTGSLLMGLLLGNEWIPLSVSLLVGTGFLGAYTTFSTFNFELFLLNKSQRRFMFLLYLFSSYLLGILLAGLGYWIGKQ